MSDLASIKLLILEDNNLETILEKLEFQNIKYEQQGTLLTCGLPPDFSSNNPRSVQIRINERLSVVIRSRSDFEGDIYSLVSYVLFNARGPEIQQTLYKAKQFICEALGIDAKGIKKLSKRVDYAKRLKDLSRKANNTHSRPNQIIPEDWLEKYADLYPDAWISEGISYNALDFFGIRIDMQTGRIIIPIRNKDGKLVGTKGRGWYLPFDKKMKYFFTDPCEQRKELFGFWVAKKYIAKKEQVFIFEGEKSIMKCFDNRIFNAVSVGSSSISDTQVKMINKLGKDIQVIIAFDKGKTPEEIKSVAEVFKDNDVYAIIDTQELLQENDSPVDRGINIFKELVNECCFAVN